MRNEAEGFFCEMKGEGMEVEGDHETTEQAPAGAPAEAPVEEDQMEGAQRAHHTAPPALQLTENDLRLRLLIHAYLQDEARRMGQLETHRQRDPLEAVQAMAGLVAQVTFMSTIVGDHAGSFLWACNAMAFTLSITAGMIVAGERMLVPAAAAGAGRLRLEMAAILTALSIAFTLLTFAAAQLSSRNNVTGALFLEARIVFPLGAPLLLFIIPFSTFLFASMSRILRRGFI